MRRLFFLAAGLLSVVLMFQSWERLRGHLYYNQVQEMKEQWYETSSVPHDRELNEGFKLGYRATEHEKDNPDYRFMLAGLHAWRERGLRLWPDQANAETDKIKQNLKAALLHRPAWFEAWMMLALVKYQSREIDYELRLALEKAIETGEYETAVHHGLAFVGLRIWDRLDPDLRKKTIQTLTVALDNPNVNEFVVEQIVMSDKTDLFREKLDSNERLTTYMKRSMEKRKASL